MRVKLVIGLLLLVSACNTSGVEKNTEKPKVKTKLYTNILDRTHKILAKKKTAEGISIEWYEQGKGELLHDGDLVMIDYKVKLKDGSVVDGNHLLKKKSLPFLIGFGMQTKGWDIALKELKVGDFARVLIPSDLARGETGIEGLIPSNADNLLFIRILSIVEPDKVVDGTKVWLLEENKRNKLKFNQKEQISFHCMASSPTSSMFVNTFRSNQPFLYKSADNGLVPGMRKALINAKKSDRLYIVVPPAEAYGTAGYLDFVKPNEPVFYNVMIIDILKL
jgi:FKBP-type peptidyl-prolyl cis-trans isomerase